MYYTIKSNNSLNIISCYFFMAMIRFENITKAYGQNTVVSNISFEVNRGELVVLIGPSGCGKTTLLKIINRLISPTSGDVFIDGQSIFQQNLIRLRRNIGYIIQQTGIFPHMTVRQNIEIIPKLQGYSKDQIAAKSIELMEMVGLDPREYLDRYPHQLSGGQQQRVGVARAFACDPEIILMDEPFSALDPPTRIQLQEELAEIQSKVKKTIVFVTHDMDEAIKIADRICILNDGKIVQYDTVEEIMKHPADEFVAEFMGKNRIWSSPEYIRAQDIMITDPVRSSPEMPIIRCIEKMRKEKVDSLMVTDKAGKLLGILTAKGARNVKDKNIPASEIMDTAFSSVSKGRNLSEILQLFKEHSLSGLPVTDKENKLAGLITKSSLLTVLSQQHLNGEQSDV